MIRHFEDLTGVFFTLNNSRIISVFNNDLGNNCQNHIGAAESKFIYDNIKDALPGVPAEFEILTINGTYNLRFEDGDFGSEILVFNYFNTSETGIASIRLNKFVDVSGLKRNSEEVSFFV
jgi:hypothetical protein